MKIFRHFMRRFCIFADMIRIFFISILWTLCFSACEKEVDIEVERIPAKLVVISNFSTGSALEPDSLMRVTVSRTSPALTESDTLIIVPDALVELYSEDLFLERLEFRLPTAEEKERGIQPYYTTKNYIPEPGRQYTLEVSAPNFRPVTAEAIIPPILSDSEASISISESVTANGFRQTNYTLDLTINDFPAVPNFYHLNLYQFVNLLRISTTGDTSRTEIVIGPLPFNLQDNSQEVLPYIDNRGALIKDTNFDGGTERFTFEGSFLYNPGSEELGDFVVELRNTSEDYYLYHSSLTRQVRVQSGFDAINGAVVLHNNIDNGCGIFAGFTPVFTRLDISD